METRCRRSRVLFMFVPHRSVRARRQKDMQAGPRKFGRNVDTMIYALHIVLVSLSILCSSEAGAATMFSEDYEVTTGSITPGSATYNDLAAKGWTITAAQDMPNSVSISIQACPSGRAGSCLRAKYPGYVCGPGITCSPNISRLYKTFMPIATLWERYYMLDTRIDPALTMMRNGKRHYINPGVSPDAWSGFWTGDGSFSGGQWFPGPTDNFFGLVNQHDPTKVTCQNGSFEVTCNMGGSQIPTDTWVCIENKFSGTTFETYVNGSPSFSSSGVVLGTVSEMHMYAQGGGNMYRWEDDWTVATTRIGCSGSPPAAAADVTPPASPVGLTIQ